MERIKFLMKKHNILNPHQLAKQVGIDYKVVNHWFTGRSTPGKENLFKLASFFHVNAEWLEDGKEEYAPTLTEDAMQFLEELQGYGPDAIQKCREMCRIMFGLPEIITPVAPIWPEIDRRVKDRRRNNYKV